MTQPKDIIEELRRARVSLGIAQYDLAETSGYNRSTIAQWETARKTPRTLQLLCNWAEAVGLEIVVRPKE